MTASDSDDMPLARIADRSPFAAQGLDRGRADFLGPPDQVRCDRGTGRGRAPEKARGQNGGSPFLCGEEPCGIEPQLRRGNTGWRATERERPVRNKGPRSGPP